MKSPGASPRRSPLFFFVASALIWIVPALGDLGTMSFTDPRKAAFREWEAMISPTVVPPFLPNGVFEKTIHGDLANLAAITDFRRLRPQRFTTDAQGYRNPPAPADMYYPVVAVGDSNMAGSSLSDRETFTAVLSRELGVPVYNTAPISLYVFLADPRFQDHPPRVLVWEALEREITGENYAPLTGVPLGVRIAPPRGGWSAPEAKWTPGPRLISRWCRWIFHTFRWRLFRIHVPAIAYIDPDTGMLFHRAGVDMLRRGIDERRMKTVVAGIRHVAEICRQRGTHLVFMPLPDKEALHRDRLPPSLGIDPAGTPFVVVLAEALRAAGVDVISPYEPFLASVRAGEGSPYFPDDTHWNPRGVEIAVQAAIPVVAPYLREPDTPPTSVKTILEKPSPP